MPSDGNVIGRLYYLITGDNSGLDKSLDQSKSKAKAFADTMKKQGKALTSVGKKLSLGLTAPIVGLGTAFVALADKQAKAEAALQNAIRATGKEAEISMENLKTYASSLQEVTTYGDEAQLSALALVQQLSNLNEEGLKQILPNMLNFSEAMGVDLQTAASLIGKTLGSSTNALSRYGVELDTSGTKTEKLAQLTQAMEERFGGAAEAAAKAGAGPLVQLKNSLGDLGEQFGELILPFLNKFVGFAKDIVGNLQNMDEGTKQLILTIGGIAAVAGPAAIAIGALMTAFSPLTAIVAGVGALTAAMVGLVNKAKMDRIAEQSGEIADKLEDAQKEGKNLATAIEGVSFETGLSVDQVIELAKEHGIVTEEIEKQLKALELAGAENEKSTDEILEQNRAYKQMMTSLIRGGHDIHFVLDKANEKWDASKTRLASILLDSETLNEEQKEILQSLIDQEIEEERIEAWQREKVKNLKEYETTQDTVLDKTLEQLELEYESLKINVEKLKGTGLYQEALTELNRIEKVISSKRAEREEAEAEAEKKRIQEVIDARNEATEEYEKNLLQLQEQRKTGYLNEEEYLNNLIQANKTYYETLSDIGYSGLGSSVGDAAMQATLNRIQTLQGELEGLREEQKEAGDEAEETSKKFDRQNRSFESFQELLKRRSNNYAENLDNFVRSMNLLGEETETVKEGFIALDDVFVGSLFGAGGVNPLQGVRSEFDNLLEGMVQLDRLDFRPGATDLNERLGISGLLLGLPAVNNELAYTIVYGEDLTESIDGVGGSVERLKNNLEGTSEAGSKTWSVLDRIGGSLENVSDKAETTQDKMDAVRAVVKDLGSTYVTQMNNIAAGFGEALVKQGDAWMELGRTAVHAIAAIIEALGEQAAVQAVVAFASLNFVEGFAWTAASALAFLTAGVVRALGDQITAAAQGTDFVTDGPQLLMVGDNPGGRERVTVEPTSSPNTRGPSNGPLHLQIYLDGRSIYEGVEEAIDNNVIKIRARTR